MNIFKENFNYWKNKILFLIIYTIFLIIIIVFFIKPREKIQINNFDKIHHQYSINEVKHIKADLSSKLNQANQLIAELECKIGNKASISNVCSSPKKQIKSDTMFAIALSEFLKNKQVASFGGEDSVFYKKTLDEMLHVLSYEAFDNFPLIETNSNGLVKYLDFSIPFFHLNKYEWIISLGMSVEIPKPSEHIFINNLLTHATEGIILNWPFDVKNQMESNGFVYDDVSSQLLRKKTDLKALISNLTVFRKNQI